ncbi:MAG: hypothetical protein WCS70_03730 [Verrucomicrobiota bacterium]
MKKIMVCAASVVVLAIAVAWGMQKLRTMQIRTFAAENVREIALALAQYSNEHQDILPANMEVVTNRLNSARTLIDPVTTKPFIYVGAGVRWQDKQERIVLYSPSGDSGRWVLFNNGHLVWMTNARFKEATR